MKNFKNFWYRPVILEQLKNYNKDKFIKDLISGIIVGVVALPLGIAFGIASGVTPEKGIISCIVAGVICALFGSSKFQISGPTGALIVIVSGVVAQHGVEGLIIATFLSGIFLLLMGIFKVGDIIRLIPYPIVVGFTSGVAITIFTTQVKDLFGLETGALPSGNIGKWTNYIDTFHTINIYAPIVAILTIVIIKVLLKISPKIPAFLISIVVVSSISYVLRHQFGLNLVTTIGDKFVIDSSLPKLQGIDLSLSNIRDLLSAGFTIAIFGSIVTLLCTAVADGIKSETHNPNTELIGQGVGNLISPLFGGIPVTGAIARTLTNINNGGQTQVVGIIHSIILLLILLFLGGLSSHIPMSCLAGVLALISYNMFAIDTFVAHLKMPKADVLVFVTTFILTVLFDLTIAIQVGLLLAVVSFVRRTTSATTISVHDKQIIPSAAGDSEISEALDIPKDIDVYEIEGPFFFGLANKFEEITRPISKNIKARIIRMRKVPFIDSTGLHNLELLCIRAKKEGLTLILSGVTEEVRKSLFSSEINKIIGDENICPHIHKAIERALEVEKSAQ